MTDFLNHPVWLEFAHVLQTHLKQNYLRGLASKNPWNSKDTQYFSRGVMKLNPLFTTERDRRSLNYFSDPVLRSGYLAYYLPVNLIKTVMILERGFGANTRWPETIRVADIGSGPLTMSLGFLLWLAYRLGPKISQHKIIFEVFEQNANILKDGNAIFRSLLNPSGLLGKAKVDLKIHRDNILRHRFTRQPQDLVLFGNVFNEVAEREDQEHLARRILENMSAPETRVIIMEPGTKKAARDVQSLRDHLIESADFTVLAPCLHQNTCPLNLEAKGDWCHFTHSWQAPDFIREMDQRTGLEKKWLVFSYLVLQKNPPHPPIYSNDRFVAITDMFKKSGKYEVVGCGPEGRVRFILLSRERSDKNRDFFELRRGRYFSIQPLKAVRPPRGEKFCNLNPNTLVKIENSLSIFTRV